MESSFVEQVAWQNRFELGTKEWNFGMGDSLPRDSRVIPFYAALLSLVVLVLHSTISSFRAKSSDFRPVFKSFADYHGGGVILAFKLARVVGCSMLLYLSAVTSPNFPNKHDQSVPALLLHSNAVLLTNSYVLLLALFSVSTWGNISRKSNFHLVSLLLVIFGVYVFRNIWPFVLINGIPADYGEGVLMWVKLGVVTFTSILIPLFMPRRYIPLDINNPMAEPNPEQTASIFSMAFYLFLDTIIVMAYRMPHLPFDKLPPLPDREYSKYTTRKSFRHLDIFSGAPKRHLGWSLLRVYRFEYIVMALMITIEAFAVYASPVAINFLLRHLEGNAADYSIRPWFWIMLLAFGPMVATLARQWYIFMATRTLVRAQALLTELIFEHSLRVRFKAETLKVEAEVLGQSASEGESSRSLSPASTEGADKNTSQSAQARSPTEEGTLYEDGEHRRSTTQVEDSQSTTSSSTIRGKQKAIKAAQQEEIPQTSSKKGSDGENLVGKINNLMSTDLEGILEGRDFLFVIWSLPLQCVICVGFLYTILGWSAFVGFGTMIALLPGPGLLANYIQKAHTESMKMTDARVQTVSEAMGVIRMIKLFGWEGKMNESIEEKRDLELKLVWKRKIIEYASGILNWVLPSIVMIVTYASYTIIMKEELNASKVFSSMTALAQIRNLLGQAFWLLSQTIKGKVSLDRVTNFLQSTELLDEFEKESYELIPQPTRPDLGEGQIGFCDATFTWSKDAAETVSTTPSQRVFRLHIDGELLFKNGSINLITGPTGCGKTSMLMALLGEMHFIPSLPTSWYNLPRAGGVAYVAQESWVQNETIRKNILFGASYDKVRYEKVLHQCGLKRDLELFDAGDMTEVGEKGLTLSGGQKARLTLARAVYSEAQILILDDVLAALDVHTAQWIVDKCLRGDLVQGRTVLLVAHNVALTEPIADQIVKFNAEGTISTYQQSPAIASSLTTVEVESDQNDEVPNEVDEPSNNQPQEARGKLIVAEEIEEGRVKWASFLMYLKGLGGRHAISFLTFVASLVIAQDVTSTFQTWYLGYWGSQYENHPASEVRVFYHLGVFIALQGIFVATYSIGYLTYTYGTIRASREIHRDLVQAVLGTTLRWLDSTPTSRVVTRCTQDIRAIDDTVSHMIWPTFELFTSALVRLCTLLLFTPIFFFPGVLVGAIGAFAGNIYIKAQLSVKREMSNARAPVLGHLGAAIAGLTSIRAYGAQDAFKEEALKRIDHYSRIARVTYNLNRWITTRIDILGAAFTTGLAAYLVYGDASSSKTGFSLAIAAEFTNTLLWMVRAYNELEMQGNSLERIRGYTMIEQEPKSSESGKPPAAWPTSGDLTVENLSARYSPAGPEVLHGLNFSIKSGERIGIVGRTGSGKSSLTLSLLRCIFTEGTVHYSGVLTNQINLDALRSNVTIIPQIPEMLSGSLRKNLDPFEQYDDATLNDALRSAGLFALQSESSESRLTLDTNIASGGGNLSVGQRQIIALARALVRGSKLLILDEATSAIDYKTDAVIQSSLRNAVGDDVTVMTIAHRLQTIMDYDRIMVLDAGKIVEFGQPNELLKIERGYLRALVDESKDKDLLYTMAKAQ